MTLPLLSSSVAASSGQGLGPAASFGSSLLGLKSLAVNAPLSVKLFAAAGLLLIQADASFPDPASGASRISISPSIAFGLTIAAGVLACFAGYKLLRVCLFALGFAVGTMVGVSMMETALPLDQGSRNVIIGLVGIAAGVVLGFLMVFFLNFGVFMLGFAGGFALGSLASFGFLYLLYQSDPAIIFWVFSVLIGIIFGCLALYFERPLLIGCTALGGAFYAIRGIGYFAGSYPNLDNLTHPQRRGIFYDVYEAPASFWYYFAATLLLALVGAVVQFKYTAKDVHHPSHDWCGRRSVPSESNAFARRQKSKEEGPGGPKVAHDNYVLLHQ